MALLVGLLTFILIVNCLVLMLLVLIQLPKKEAGAGVAFGAGATDALFGAGSGNALTKMTKYAASFFVGLSLLLSLINSHRAQRSHQGIEQELLKRASGSAATLPLTSPTNRQAPATQTASPVTPTNSLPLQSTPPATQTVVTPTPPARTAPANSNQAGAKPATNAAAPVK